MNSRHYITLLAATLASSLIIGCSPEKKETPSSSQTTSEKAETVVKNSTETVKEVAADTHDAIADTWDSIKDATYDERVDFSNSIASMATSIDNNIDALGEKTGTLSEEAKESWNNGMENLREARDDLNEKLENLGDATADTWDEAREEVSDAWTRVELAYNNLKQDVNS